MENNKSIIEFKNLSKYFAGVKALKNVSFKIFNGEIHAIVGENGAGKSTLIKILGGVYSRYSGDVFINGIDTRITNPKISKDLGVRVVYQEFPMCDNLTVAGNIFLGPDLIRSRRFGFLDWDRMYKKAKESLHGLGVDIDVRAAVSNLPIAEKQIIEIVKAVSKKANIIIMDEPTSALNAEEVSFLFNLIKKLKDIGITIIYISHHLEEVFKIADRITILKDGNYIDTLDRNKTSISKVISLMIGRKEESLFKKKENYSEDGYVLKLENVQLCKVLDGVSFGLKKKEILGLAGLMGSGTQEVLRILFGIEKKYKGDVYLNGHKFVPKFPMSSINHGFGFIPPDRRAEGLSTEANIIMNMAFPFLRKNLRRKVVNLNELHTKVKKEVERLDIKVSDINQTVKNLSGGNQQKVVIAKWFSSDSEILLMDNPTRGVDVGARSEIYSILNESAKSGISIIITSTELEDIMNICDRVLVFFKGKIVKEIKREEINEDELLLYCTSGAT